MNVAFKEVQAWISTAVTILVFAYYVVQAPHAATTADMYRLVVGVMIAVVVLQLVLFAIAAVMHRPENTDERDRLIATKSLRNAYFVFVAGTIPLIFLVLERPAPMLSSASVPLPALVVHWLVLTMAASELFRTASVIFYYRRGA